MTENVISVLRIIVPIFTVIFLGALARRRQLLSGQEIRGLQQFAMNYCLPCVLFNSCLSCTFGAQSIIAMVLLIPALLVGSMIGFRLRKDKFPYHNFPLFVSVKESGMMGIPLFMTLFGAQQAYHMGILDMAQAFVAIPMLALLSAPADENPTPRAIAGQVFRSPLLIMSTLALTLNLTGCADWLNRVGIGGIITDTTGFLAAPVSAVILFSVGYNFSLGQGERKTIAKICAVSLLFYAIVCGVIQCALLLVPDVAPATRWAVLLYCMLPGSYLAPTLARTDEEATLASGACSMLTVVCLAVFCVAVAFVS